MNKFNSIDTYIASVPEDRRRLLEKIRSTIHAAAPEASETIKYQMPTFYLSGNLVHFAAFKNHIGFFPTPSGIAPFAKELTGYITSRGTIQFPYDQPIPFDLITRIVKQRVQENLARSKNKPL